MRSLALRAAEDFEGHCRADKLAEAVGQRLHLVPLTFARTACGAPDQEEQKRSNRERCQKKKRRERICKCGYNQDEGDENCACDHCRQDHMKKRIERIDAFKRQRQCAGDVTPLCEHCLMQSLAAGEAQMMGELRLDMSFWQAQERHGENAQKQHQKF